MKLEQSRLSSKNLQMTASFGIANIREHASDGRTLVEKADEAMYQAKDLGRNCVRVSGEGGDDPRPTHA